MSESAKPKGKRKVTIHRQKFVGHIYVTAVGLHELTEKALKMSNVATFFKCDSRTIKAHYELNKIQLQDRGIEYNSEKKVFLVKELRFHDRKTKEYKITT